jgi:hypothetical protein
MASAMKTFEQSLAEMAVASKEESEKQTQCEELLAVRF